MPAVLADPEPLTIEFPKDVKPGGPSGGGPRDFDRHRGGGGGGDDGDNEAERAGPESAPGAGLLAMRIMLISICTLFVTIAIVYFVRSRTPVSWKPVAVPGFLWVSTALIVASSWSLEGARRAFLHLKINDYARWLLITFFLGFGFLISQLLSLRQLVGQGIYLRHNPHSSLFYVVTGAHGLHLLGGMATLFYLVVRASLGTANVRIELSRQCTVMNVSTLYWHFLDALWVGLFTMLLLWR